LTFFALVNEIRDVELRGLGLFSAEILVHGALLSSVVVNLLPVFLLL